MLNLFNKKQKTTEEFTPTQRFMVDMLQYDEGRQLIKLKGSKDLIPVEDIQSYTLTFGNKTYNKANLGKALIGGAVLGLAGVALAGTHKEEYVSNIKITVKAADKTYVLPLTIGKMKIQAAKSILDRAEDMIKFLDSITE
jgi:hypothetical protein